MRVLDCASVLSEAEFWELYVSELRPEGAEQFGRNLDALWDALNGGPGWPGEGEIVLRNAERLSPLREGAFLRALREVARDANLVKLTLA